MSPKTFRKNQRAKKQQAVSFTNDTFVIPRPIPIFPPTLNKKLRFSLTNTTLTSTNYNPFSFYGNSIMQCGPQLNWSGGFGANVPTGATYFLSSNTTAGSNSPYGQYFVRSSKIHVTCSAQAGGSTPALVTIVPSVNASLSGISLSNILEQPRAVSYPVGQTATELNSVISNSCSTQAIFGYKNPSSLEADPNLSGEVQVNAGIPPKAWFWHVLLTAMNASSTAAFYVTVAIDYDVEFRRYNTPSSTTPT